MKKMFLLLMILFSEIGFAKEPAAKILDKLTIQMIALRSGLEYCEKNDAFSAIAGQKFRQILESDISSIDPKSFKKPSWLKKIKNAKHCVSDCSCHALAEIQQAFPKNKFDIKTIEKKLSVMTDNDYIRCRKKIQNFCKHKDVKSFIEDVRAESSSVGEGR